MTLVVHLLLNQQLLVNLIHKHHRLEKEQVVVETKNKVVKVVMVEYQVVSCTAVTLLLTHQVQMVDYLHQVQIERNLLEVVAEDTTVVEDQVVTHKNIQFMVYMVVADHLTMVTHR